jgi:hypothetical protein
MFALVQNMSVLFVLNACSTCFLHLMFGFVGVFCCDRIREPRKLECEPNMPAKTRTYPSPRGLIRRRDCKSVIRQHLSSFWLQPNKITCHEITSQRTSCNVTTVNRRVFCLHISKLHANTNYFIVHFTCILHILN